MDGIRRVQAIFYSLYIKVSDLCTVYTVCVPPLSLRIQDEKNLIEQSVV